MEVVHKKSQSYGSSTQKVSEFRVTRNKLKNWELWLSRSGVILRGGQGLVSTLIKGIFGAEYLKNKSLFLPVSEHSPSDVN